MHQKAQALGNVGAGAGGKVGEGAGLPRSLCPGHHRLGEACRQQRPRQGGGGVHAIGPSPAQGNGQGRAHRARGTCDPPDGALAPGHPLILLRAAHRQQAVVGDRLAGAADEIIRERVQPHGPAHAQQSPACHHAKGRSRPHQAGGDQGALAAQKIRDHAAGHLAQKADQVKKALGQADLRQRKPPAGKQRQPDDLGQPKGSEKFQAVQPGDLHLDFHKKVLPQKGLALPSGSAGGAPFVKGSLFHHDTGAGAPARPLCVLIQPDPPGAASLPRLVPPPAAGPAGYRRQTFGGFKKGALIHGSAGMLPF